MSHTIHYDGRHLFPSHTCHHHSTCVGPSMRGWQWIKCQCAHATSCSDHPRGNWVVHWIQPGDSWLISWPSHSNRTLQAVGLPSSVSTRDRSDGDRDCYNGYIPLSWCNLIDRFPKTLNISLCPSVILITRYIVRDRANSNLAIYIRLVLREKLFLAILLRYAPWRGDMPLLKSEQTKVVRVNKITACNHFKSWYLRVNSGLSGPIFFKSVLVSNLSTCARVSVLLMQQTALIYINVCLRLMCTSNLLEL